MAEALKCISQTQRSFKMHKAIRCKECDAMLWSDYAKSIKTCPDCETPDKEEKDLEDQLGEIMGA
ncbi:hypothetical protein D3C84_899560 [compost metagenome]